MVKTPARVKPNMLIVSVTSWLCVLLHHVDIDECDLQLYNCSLYSECNNTVGSYTCECMSGTEKDTDGTCKGRCFLYLSI